MQVRVLPGVPMESSNKVANLLKLMKMLETRLHSKGHAPNVLGDTVEISIYSTERLMTFLEMSLQDFNQVPFFTFYTFNDNVFIEQFGSLLVEGATVYALASQSLIEKGREFTTSSSGISYDPPTVSELLNSQYEQLYTNHWKKLKYIKLHIKEFVA